MDSPKTFEESLPSLDEELIKRSHKWHLTALAHLDYDDVCQIIRRHIFKKWNQYNPSMPFKNWANSIISSQLTNIIRNVYWNHERPCLDCAHNLEDGHCAITYSGTQCNECPLYLKWSQTKKSAHDIKLAVSMEGHLTEVHNKVDEFYDLEINVNRLNKRLELELPAHEWKFYKAYFIEHKSEEEVAAIMGFRSGEVNRPPGYKRLKQLQKIIAAKAKLILKEGLN
jgi:RNA polymerase sigma factor (sigma-70 family)